MVFIGSPTSSKYYSSIHQVLVLGTLSCVWVSVVGLGFCDLPFPGLPLSPVVTSFLLILILEIGC